MLASGDYRNVVVISGNEPDPDPDNNEDDASSSPSPLADLAVTKTVDNGTPLYGDNVTFTVTASNAGPYDASAVSLEDLLPDGYELVSFDVSAGAFDNASGLWLIGDLGVGESASMSMVVTVLGDQTTELDYQNDAMVWALDPDDPNLDNNTASASVSPRAVSIPPGPEHRDPVFIPVNSPMALLLLLGLVALVGGVSSTRQRFS